MIGATIAEIELKSISAIVVAMITAIAAIAEGCFQIIAAIDGLFFNDGSDRCDHMETTLEGLERPIILAKANILIRNVMNFYELM